MGNCDILSISSRIFRASYSQRQLMYIGHDEMNNLQSAYAHMAASDSLGLRKGKHRALSDNKFHVILTLTFVELFLMARLFEWLSPSRTCDMSRSQWAFSRVTSSLISSLHVDCQFSESLVAINMTFVVLCSVAQARARCLGVREFQFWGSGFRLGLGLGSASQDLTNDRENFRLGFGNSQILARTRAYEKSRLAHLWCTSLAQCSIVRKIDCSMHTQGHPLSFTSSHP